MRGLHRQPHKKACTRKRLLIADECPGRCEGMEKSTMVLRVPPVHTIKMHNFVVASTKCYWHHDLTIALQQNGQAHFS